MQEKAEMRSLAWLIVAAAGVRATFGIFVAIDAYLKWQLGFAAHYVGYLQNAANGQPPWLSPWFHFWIQLVAPRANFFILATRLIESDAIMSEPGKYPIVDHSMRAMTIGAAGELEVTQ